MHPRRRTTTAAIALTASLALAASACSGSDSAGGNKAGAGTGVLTVGMPNGVQANNSNPFLGTSAGASLGYRHMIYEPLAMVNMIRPDQKPKPWLAEGWEWTPDFKKLTLTVRKGPKWSDGKELTPDDVAYTFELLKKYPALNPDGIAYDGITVNGQSVELTFQQSQYVNQAKIIDNFIVPKHIWEKVSDPTTFTNEKPVGSGPYTLKTFTPQTITLTRTKTYWQDLPKVSELRYTSYNDNNAQTTALASGKCEWSFVFMPNHEKLFIAKDPENNKLWFPSGIGIHGVWFNTAQGPFKDVALRKAVNMVIDREKIFTVAEAKLYPKIENVTGLPLPAADAFIADPYKGKNLEVDVEGAKKVLSDAGYTTKGDKLYDPAGKQVKFTLTDPAGWNDYLTGLSLIRDAVKDLGIEAKVTTQTVDAWSKNVNEGKFDATLHWTNTGATPYDTYDHIMSGKHYQPVGTAAPGGNFGRFQSDAATKALEDFANATDEAARKTAMDELQRIMVEEVPVAPTSAGPIGAEYSTKNWVGWPDESNPYGPPQPTQHNALDVVMHLKPAN
ncbi:ABC transporter substrate-binding protein [Streptomyces sp. NPDC051940]|uniref:ABC transporter substrate-binding protein n=1 Tax=Streptomyces sp. NPDC051940 TaxID=3155675 RepID=UPI00342C4E45